MNEKIERLLRSQGKNYILPFFWQHGEKEAVLREYMQAIHSAGIGAVCVESRPHPDFCGPKWWADMDVILEEAKKNNMKVWILDDSHFPSGYANGALVQASPELCRQSIYSQFIEVIESKKVIDISIKKQLHPKLKSTMMDRLVNSGKKLRTFDDDRLLCVSAFRTDKKEKESMIELTEFVTDGILKWKVPEGKWRIYITTLTRNAGPHRSYINMLDQKSCRIFIDTVYEAHYSRYKEEFGNTIAGFFSDEPELGNHHVYPKDNILGTDQDLPWGQEMDQELRKRLGNDWRTYLPLLLENDYDSDLTARVRYAYMDSVTRLVEKNFSCQIGEWCRERGVEYIGHLIEDNNQHCRTGSSLGHFYRGLSGQDMSGIDDIGGQVLPQGEDEPKKAILSARDGEFYHFALGKLGASYGAIDPLKKGRTMCEIFGNYGWKEGVQLEKYLADHFMVRGVNHFVPHAFSPKTYPDTDCPPHFYAGGNDPLFRHFGCLMRYMNRVCDLISDGYHVAPVAILYHGEAEWTGKCMLMQKPARKLAERQIDYDFIPSDVFVETERYKTSLKNGLKVNTQEYKVLVIPTTQFISVALAESISQLIAMDFPVIFLEALPEGIYDGDNGLLENIKASNVIQLDKLIEWMDKLLVPEVNIIPASSYVRYLHYKNGSDLWYLVNEAANTYHGTIRLPLKGKCYAYNAWDNRVEHIESKELLEGTEIYVTIEPQKSLIIVFDDMDETLLLNPVVRKGKEVKLIKEWSRSICRSINYPDFHDQKVVKLPDQLAKEKPKFSGFVRYANTFNANKKESMILEITDAAEGVEVFVNDESVGIQIVPPYRYDLTTFIREGENNLRIEVATTLERESGRKGLIAKITAGKTSGLSGITGEVKLYHVLE